MKVRMPVSTGPVQGGGDQGASHAQRERALVTDAAHHRQAIGERGREREFEGTEHGAGQHQEERRDADHHDFTLQHGTEDLAALTCNHPERHEHADDPEHERRGQGWKRLLACDAPKTLTVTATIGYTQGVRLTTNPPANAANAAYSGPLAKARVKASPASDVTGARDAAAAMLGASTHNAASARASANSIRTRVREAFTI